MNSSVLRMKCVRRRSEIYRRKDYGCYMALDIAVLDKGRSLCAMHIIVLHLANFFYMRCRTLWLHAHVLNYSRYLHIVHCCV